MKPCTSINCFFDQNYQVPVEAQILRLYDAGFRVMDMNFWDWCHNPESPFVKDGWEQWIDRIGGIAARYGIQFVQSHAHVCNFYREPDAQDKFRLFERSLRASAMLGIPWVVFHPSMVPDMDREQMHQDNLRFFAPLVDLAEKLGTGIALENMARVEFGCITAEELAQLIDRFNSPAVGACWDTGHAHIAGQTQGQSIITLGKRLHALHIQDNNAQSDQHLAPYQGTIDWDDTMQGLAAIDYPHAFTFEAHNIVRGMPNGVQGDAARQLYQIGLELCRKFEAMEKGE